MMAMACRVSTIAAALGFALALALSLDAALPATTAPESDAGSRAIRRALRFLVAHQVTEPLLITTGEESLRDYPGDWPQFFALRGRPALRVRDVSPFIVAFIHHALSHLVEDNRQRLGLSRRETSAPPARSGSGPSSSSHASNRPRMRPTPARSGSGPTISFPTCRSPPWDWRSSLWRLLLDTGCGCFRTIQREGSPSSYGFADDWVAWRFREKTEGHEKDSTRGPVRS